jgi:hypothetical protein
MSTIVLLCAAAAAVAGCAQTEDFMSGVKEKTFSAPSKLFSMKLPDWGQRNEAGDNFDLGPKGPVAANDLISRDGHCAPAAEPKPAPQAAAPAPKPVAAPPSDRLEPGGPAPTPQAAPMMGGVALGMSECAVARRLGTPSNVSISAGPKGKRRVVLTYMQGERPGLYSFLSGRLIQMDATPQQATKYDKRAKKPSRRTRRQAERMYVQ